MKSWIALVLALAATGLVFVSVTDPLFQAAAREICGNYARESGYTLVDSQGYLGRLGYLGGLERRSGLRDFRCTFEDATGRKIFIDQFDQVVERTGRYRLFRFLGWTLPVVGAAIGMTAAAKLGLIGDD